MYSFIKIGSVQYAKTCHVGIVYNCTSVIIIDYTEKFSMHRETLGSFHAGSASLRISNLLTLAEWSSLLAILYALLSRLSSDYQLFI